MSDYNSFSFMNEPIVVMAKIGIVVQFFVVRVLARVTTIGSVGHPPRKPTLPPTIKLSALTEHAGDDSMLAQPVVGAQLRRNLSPYIAHAFSAYPTHHPRSLFMR